MDRWNATGSAFTRLGFDPTGVREGWSRSGDPTGVDRDIKGFGGQDPLLDYGMSAFADQMAKDQAAQQQFNGFWSGQAGQGNMASLGGAWANIDRWNNEIQAAANKYGVPANLIKAVMKLESGGVNAGRNGAGAIGLMQVVDRYWGDLGYNLYDPAQNVMAGAHVLREMYDTYQQWAVQNGVDPWKAAVYSYYAGNPYNLNARDNPAQGGSGITTGGYGDQIWSDYMMLGQMGTPMSGATTAGGHGGSATSLSALFGDAPISFEFGVDNNLGYYTYGTQYGLNGSEHTGLDISVPRGTAIRAPMAGTITCAATDNGYCAAFKDTDGGGVGRLELQLDNGAILIFGHSATSSVRAGQRVNVGDVIGTSGGMNGAHVHLEARVPDPSMPSGYRIVDPRQVLGGGSGGMFGGQAPMPTQGYSSGGSMLDQMWRFLTQPGASW